MIVVRVKMAMILLLLMMMMHRWWLWWRQWSPLLHVDALAVVAGELSFRAGRQLYPFHLHVVEMSKNLKGYENKNQNKNQNVKELKRIWIRDENVWWGQNGDLLTMRIWMVNMIHTWLKKVIRNLVGTRSGIAYFYIFIFSPGTLQLRCGTCHPSPRRSRRRGRLQNTLTL